MNKKNSSIQVEYHVSNDIDYLDATISWIKDEDNDDMNQYQLETTVNHLSRAEPYIDDDVSSTIYSKLFRSALSRVTLCCSDVYQFQQEERYIELSFRLNQFSADFIRKHLCLFFREFNIGIGEFYANRHSLYGELRQRVIDDDRKHREKKLLSI